MIFDLIAGMNAGGGASTWTPAELFQNGERGYWFDGSDYTTMSQSRSDAVAVTGAGQPIGQWHNKIVGQATFNFVAANDSRRPLTKDASGKLSVAYDGVDDQLITPDTGLVVGGAMSLFIGEKLGVIGDNLNLISSLSGTTIEIANNSNRTVKGSAFNRTVTSSALTSTTLANTIGLMGGSSLPTTLRVNGTQSTGSNGTAGSVGSSFAMVGDAALVCDVSQVVFINRALTTEEITLLEAFIGSKQ